MLMATCVMQPEHPSHLLLERGNFGNNAIHMGFNTAQFEIAKFDYIFSSEAYR